MRRFLEPPKETLSRTREEAETEPEGEVSPAKKKEEREEYRAPALFRQLKTLFEAASDGVIEFNPIARSHPNEAEIRAIRFAYCALGWSAIRISEALGRNYRCVSRVIYKGKYQKLRERVDERLIKNAVGRMEGDVEAVTALTTAALKRYLTQVVHGDKEMSVKDAKLISDIGANFHRILQLLKNKPTAIHANLGSMSEEGSIEALVGVLKRMRQDPMFDMDAFLSRVGLTREEVKGVIEAEGGSLDDFDA